MFFIGESIRICHGWVFCSWSTIERMKSQLFTNTQHGWMNSCPGSGILLRIYKAGQVEALDIITEVESYFHQSKKSEAVVVVGWIRDKTTNIAAGYQKKPAPSPWPKDHVVREIVVMRERETGLLYLIGSKRSKRIVNSTNKNSNSKQPQRFGWMAVYMTTRSRCARVVITHGVLCVFFVPKGLLLQSEYLYTINFFALNLFVYVNQVNC